MEACINMGVTRKLPCTTPLVSTLLEGGGLQLKLPPIIPFLQVLLFLSPHHPVSIFLVLMVWEATHRVISRHFRHNPPLLPSSITIIYNNNNHRHTTFNTCRNNNHNSSNNTITNLPNYPGFTIRSTVPRSTPMGKLTTSLL